ncbi:MAG: hypothetical protein ACTSYG_07620 [Candidatus Heimdallarchaeota archaeon]
MIHAEYRAGFMYDIYYEKFIKDLAKNMEALDDDFLVMYIGATGTGKTSLAMHGMELFLGTERAAKIGVDLIGLTKQSFADALDTSSKMEHPRIELYDEANISKRDSLSSFNKEMLDLFFSLRGLNIMHMWCNPSLEMIDKSFLREKIRGIFFIPGKNPKARRYYFFRRTDLLKIWEKYKRLDLDILRKVKGTAYFCGWFRPYKGVMWKKYLKKKQSRMLEKVETFYAKYGSKIKEFRNEDIRRILDCSPKTIQKYVVNMEKEGLIVQDKHFRRTGNNTRKFTEQGVNLVVKYGKAKLEHFKKVFSGAKK